MQIHIDKETESWPDSFNTLMDLMAFIGDIKLSQVECRYRIKVDIEPIKEESKE